MLSIIITHVNLAFGFLPRSPCNQMIQVRDSDSRYIIKGVGCSPFFNSTQLLSKLETKDLSKTLKLPYNVRHQLQPCSPHPSPLAFDPVHR